LEVGVMVRLLLTGGSGQLGRDFRRYYTDQYDILPLDREHCDVTNLEQVRECFAQHRPEVVLHAAAFTKVDKAEREPDQAFAVNALGSRNVALAAAETGCRLIAISTDYVFSGKKGHPYHEYDPPDPVNVYGRSKLAGEEAIKLLCRDHIILRTSWLYGSGVCFPRNIIRLAREKAAAREPLLVVNDQSGTPTSTRALSGVIHDLIGHPLPAGVIHATCSGVASWYELAHEVVTRLEIPCRLQPCSTDEVPRPAARPSCSVLDNMLLRLEGRDPLPPWREELQHWLDENNNTFPA
jgi:dTDP-4-dehydrorhamnose reductase